jgi:hypothetical protein
MNNDSAGNNELVPWAAIFGDALRVMSCVMAGIIGELTVIKFAASTGFAAAIAVLVVVLAASGAAFYVGKLVRRTAGLR